MEQIEIDLIRLAVLKEKLAEYDELKAEYDDLRNALLEDMRAMKSKRTEAIGGLYAIRAERRSVTVADPQAVERWMEENGYNTDEYKRLDAAMVKQLNDQMEKQYKVTLPGIETELTETITIRSAKDAS